MNGITINYMRNGDAEVRFAYNAELVASFKRVVAGVGNIHARWCPSNKVWLVTKSRVETLKAWVAAVSSGTAITDADREAAKKRQNKKRYNPHAGAWYAKFNDEDDFYAIGKEPPEAWYRMQGYRV